MSASTAWSDESFQEHDDTGFYIIAAAVIEDDALDRARERMLHLQAKHASTKVHWTKADTAQRGELARTVAALDGLHVVAVGAPVRPRRQERARAHCLNLLVCELHGFGVEHLFMEARDPVLNARDVATVQQARYALPPAPLNRGRTGRAAVRKHGRGGRRGPPCRVEAVAPDQRPPRGPRPRRPPARRRPG